MCKVENNDRARKVLEVFELVNPSPILASDAPSSIITEDRRPSTQSLVSKFSNEPVSSSLASSDGKVEFMRDR